MAKRVHMGAHFAQVEVGDPNRYACLPAAALDALAVAYLKVLFFHLEPTKSTPRSFKRGGWKHAENNVLLLQQQPAEVILVPVGASAQRQGIRIRSLRKAEAIVTES